MRFTKSNRQKVLNDNEGFVTKTHNSQRNFTEDRTYTISDGELHVRARGKTSWADSRYDETYTYGPDDEETKRFLRNNRELLKLDD